MATWEISNVLGKRVAYVRLSGVFTEEEMRAVRSEADAKILDVYKGRKHILIADMRGMKTLAAGPAQVFGEYIAEHRAKGVALCVHISDETVQRLQARRIARENSPNDDITVDVASLEEAHRVVEELRHRLDSDGYVASIR